MGRIIGCTKPRFVACNLFHQKPTIRISTWTMSRQGLGLTPKSYSLATSPPATPKSGSPSANLSTGAAGLRHALPGGPNPVWESRLALVTAAYLGHPIREEDMKKIKSVLRDRLPKELTPGEVLETVKKANETQKGGSL